MPKGSANRPLLKPKICWAIQGFLDREFSYSFPTQEIDIMIHCLEKVLHLGKEATFEGEASPSKLAPQDCTFRHPLFTIHHSPPTLNV